MAVPLPQAMEVPGNYFLILLRMVYLDILVEVAEAALIRLEARLLGLEALVV